MAQLKWVHVEDCHETGRTPVSLPRSQITLARLRAKDALDDMKNRDQGSRLELLAVQVYHRSHNTLAMFRADYALKSAGLCGWVRGTGGCARPGRDRRFGQEVLIRR
jgi:hypothetical protein